MDEVYVKYPESLSNWRLPSEGVDRLWLAEGSAATSCPSTGLEDSCRGQRDLVEKMEPRALTWPGVCKLLFAKTAAHGLWGSGKQDLS